MRRHHLVIVVIAVFALLLAATPASALLFRVSFTAEDFGPGAPADPVSGFVEYNANSITSPIQSISSIGLTIDGHVYTLAEIGFISPASIDHLVGGTINEIDGLIGGTNDFALVWNIQTQAPSLFVYTTENTDIPFQTGLFSQFSVVDTSVVVPEAATLWTMISGAVLLGLLIRQRGRTQRT
jgi:hypothetical protein